MILLVKRLKICQRLKILKFAKSKKLTKIKYNKAFQTKSFATKARLTFT